MATHNSTAHRNVRVTARTGGSLRKGNRYSTSTGVSEATRALWAEPSPYDADNKLSGFVLDKLANRALAGLSDSSPTKGARWGQVCPACGMQRSRNNRCDCNS